MSDSHSSSSSAQRNGTRRKALTGIGSVVLLAGVGYGLYWGLHARYYVSTDNAYVAGNVVQITPQVAGTVLAIHVQDTDFVKAGQPLVRLDPADAQVALDQAQAQLGQTVREVRTLFVNESTYEATVRLRQADLARTRSDLGRVQEDLARRQALTAKGAVSKEELEHAQSAVAAAMTAVAAGDAGVAAAREQVASNHALIDGTTVEQHPNVERAAAKVREAYLAFKRADIVAPVSGYVAKRSVQVGQRVPAGTPLMSVIPLNQVWVDANFKEVQLADMRIGQPVKLKADLYGSKVAYTGRLVGVGAGTGAAFALLPAQNATGNWIKVVQRVPVRIAIDAQQLADHPLRVGLSMEAVVDVHDQSGKTLAQASALQSDAEVGARAMSQTDVFGSGADPRADAVVRQIIARNTGGRGAQVRANVAVAKVSGLPKTVASGVAAKASDAAAVKLAQVR